MLRQKISIEALQRSKSTFIALSKITCEDIKTIWFESGDVDYDVSNIKAENRFTDPVFPLYMKMVYRFCNCNKRAAQFCHQIDINNQHLFLNHITRHRVYDSNIHTMTDFFAWLSNMKGPYHILQLEGVEQSESKYLARWNADPITWFYDDLDVVKQQQLIDEYNEKEIVAYNDIMAEFVPQNFRTMLQAAATDLESLNLEEDLEASE
jgi:hypothetical protein